MPLISQQGIIGTVLTRIKNRKKLVHFQSTFQSIIIPSDLQAQIDAKAQQLIDKGFPPRIVDAGKKQVQDFALGIAVTYGAPDQAVEQKIVNNAIKFAIKPDGMFDHFVRGLSSAFVE